MSEIQKLSQIPNLSEIVSALELTTHTSDLSAQDLFRLSSLTHVDSAPNAPICCTSRLQSVDLPIVTLPLDLFTFLIPSRFPTEKCLRTFQALLLKLPKQSKCFSGSLMAASSPISGVAAFAVSSLLVRSSLL